jgi:hypothetical protein
MADDIKPLPQSAKSKEIKINLQMLKILVIFVLSKRQGYDRLPGLLNSAYSIR